MEGTEDGSRCASMRAAARTPSARECRSLNSEFTARRPVLGRRKRSARSKARARLLAGRHAPDPGPSWGNLRRAPQHCLTRAARTSWKRLAEQQIRAAAGHPTEMPPYRRSRPAGGSGTAGPGRSARHGESGRPPGPVAPPTIPLPDTLHGPTNPHRRPNSPPNQVDFARPRLRSASHCPILALR